MPPLSVLLRLHTFEWATEYKAIMDNAELFAGKRVLDVGTGSGILAIWAAQAGATKVNEKTGVQTRSSGEFMFLAGGRFTFVAVS